MHLVAIGWLYVTLMMALAEALGPQGSVLGGLVTFVLYGLLPLSIVLYVMGAPARRAARRRREAAPDPGPSRTDRAPSSVDPDPDAGGHAARDPVAPVGKEA